MQVVVKLFYVTALMGFSLGAQEPPDEVRAEHFENSIRPLFAQKCTGCHGETASGGLRLNTREQLLKGGVSGPALVPGDPDKSLILTRIRHTDSAKRMPLGAPALTDADTAKVTKWISDGAYWPREVPTAAAQTQFFEEHVRPVIATQCFNCHTTIKAGGLELDTREGMLKGGKSGPALVPGDPDKSLLITAIRRTNPALLMPKNGSPLTPSQIENLIKWVKHGAVWPAAAPESKFTQSDAQRNLWSIQSLSRPEPPKVKDPAWGATAIDRFVASKWEAKGLKPAPMAHRRALLRRASYDLIGLPPTYEELKAFEGDTAPGAWERAIDRLQASPRYGEKWARHWMDVVRFAEDDYYVSGENRAERYKFAYTYRDWLIKAFNEDMPYDQFVRSQLAGDLLEGEAREKAVAGLGLHGVGVWHMTNMAPQIERADDWADRVDVTAKAFLGLTVGCARCHDHKYDAIPTKDYYALAGVFASSPYKDYPLVDKPIVEAYEKKKKELEEKEKGLKELIEKATELESSILFLQSESYMVAAWRVGADRKATVETIANQEKLDAELLGRWVRFLKRPQGNYSFLKNWQDMVSKGGTIDDAKRLAREFYLLAEGIRQEKAKIQKENETQLAKITDPDAKEIFDPLPNGRKRSLKSFLLDLKGIDQEKGQLWTDMFDFELPDPNKVGDGADAFSFRKGRPPGLLKFTDFALEKRLPADWAAQIARMKADIDAFKKEMGEHYPFAYGIGELEKPVDLRVFVRGNPDVFGEVAPRSFLSMLSDGVAKPFTKGSGRLELAEEILKEPLAARVIANRVWTWLMGSGIVQTPNNFGMIGAPPSNADLLDYLASEFRSNGLSIKKLQKSILLSRTYQLSTASVAASASKDPDNLLYWRSNVRRLDAEGVWDYLLSASGKLDLAQLGGPSKELAEGMTRRGVYGVSSRMFPNAFQLTFDFQTPMVSIERRYTTTIPQQRLFFLNSPIVRNQAQAMAERIGAGGTQEGQVVKAFEFALQRRPTDTEVAASIEFLGDPKLRGEKAAEDSPLKSLCWALLSSTEFLYLN